MWPRGVCATVVLLLNLCFFSGGTVKREDANSIRGVADCPAALYNSLGVSSAFRPLIKGRGPLHGVIYGVTFAQHLLEVARRKDGPVVKG